MFFRPLALVAALILTGCAYPDTTARTIESKSQLAIANASPSSKLFIDRVLIGPAAAYDGKKNTLQIGRGTHHIEVQDRGRILFSQTVYLGNDPIETIILPN